MKNLFYLILLVLFLSSCCEDDVKPVTLSGNEIGQLNCDEVKFYINAHNIQTVLYSEIKQTDYYLVTFSDGAKCYVDSDTYDCLN